MNKLLFAAAILFLGCNTTPTESTTPTTTDSTKVDTTVVNTLDTSIVDTIKIID